MHEHIRSRIYELQQNIWNGVDRQREVKSASKVDELPKSRGRRSREDGATNVVLDVDHVIKGLYLVSETMKQTEFLLNDVIDQDELDETHGKVDHATQVYGVSHEQSHEGYDKLNNSS